MCGITGIFSFSQGNSLNPPDKSVLQKMTRTLTYRGPDSEGYYTDEFVGLGHRRLAIIDLSPQGKEPMTNEDRTIWLTFNGEIYNFKVLHEELLKKGHRFSSETDAEVIIHGYEEFGDAIVQKIQGMFAFGLWDSRKKRMLLARDRVGKKPLVYYFDPQKKIFLFASELKALLEYPNVPRQIKKQSLQTYLAYGYVPAPATIFENMFKILPGYLLTIDSSGKIETKQYWDLSFAVVEQSASYYEAHILQALENATRCRLMSDVPLGAFLSGGIDSSSVVAMMAKLRRGTGEEVKTFTVGFEESAFDETKYARIVAEKFSTDHKEFIVRPDAISILPKLVWHYNEPFSDSSALPSYYVAQMTRKHVTVALNGDGGDESFAGYNRYMVWKAASMYCKIPSLFRCALAKSLQPFPEPLSAKSFFRKMRRFIEVAELPTGLQYIALSRTFLAPQLEALLSPQNKVNEEEINYFILDELEKVKANDPLSQMQYVDIKRYLPDDLLVKMDIAAMANSLEARSPYLDSQVMELAAKIPPELKMRGLTKKYVLKRALSQVLPREILHRRKMGFGVPIGPWFKGDLGNLSEQILLSKEAQRGYFQKPALQKLFEEHRSGRVDHSSRLWNLLWLELWHRIYIDPEKIKEPTSMERLL